MKNKTLNTYGDRIINGHLIEKLEHPKRKNDPEYMGDRSFRWHTLIHYGREMLFTNLKNATAWANNN